MIFRYPYQDDALLATSFQQAAGRLAGTIRGEPIDDTMLLPFLTLYRQAFELRLKTMIREFASLRRRFHESGNPDLATAKIEQRLRTSRILGHNLDALMNELIGHYNALETDEPFRESIKDLLLLLHEADSTGTAFRYSGQMPDIQESLDFLDLVALLDTGFELREACSMGSPSCTPQDHCRRTRATGDEPEGLDGR